LDSKSFQIVDLTWKQVEEEGDIRIVSCNCQEYEDTDTCRHAELLSEKLSGSNWVLSVHTADRNAPAPEKDWTPEQIRQWYLKYRTIELL
jgi:hypothetical protein